MYVIYYVTATGVQLLHPLGSRQRHADRNRFSPGHALFNRVGSGPKDLRLVYPGHGPLQRLRQSRTGSYTTRGPHGKKEVVGRTAAPDAKHFDPGRSGCYQQLRRRGGRIQFFLYHADPLPCRNLLGLHRGLPLKIRVDRNTPCHQPQRTGFRTLTREAFTHRPEGPTEPGTPA